MKMERQSPGRGRRWAASVVAVVLAGCQGPFPQTTFDPITSIGRDIDNLFMLVFGLAVFVFVLVEAALIWVLIKYRARPGAPDPKPIHGHTTLEIAWTLAPAFIIALIAIPTISTIWEEAADPPPDALQIDVIGHQWWWEFRYPDLNVVTANELHMPVGRPVVLNMTSADVIHSFWGPRFTGKRDLMLGRTTRLSFTPDSIGDYSGQCAEYCGASHANMRFRMMVDDSMDFEAWVTRQRSGPPDLGALTPLQQRGLEVYRAVRDPASNSCLACHTVQGISAGVLGPNLTHMGSRTTIAGGILQNTPEGLAGWLRDPAAVKPGSLMPNVGLTEEEIDALVAFLLALE
jgi:cytochrome c oxidase subunit 2